MDTMLTLHSSFYLYIVCMEHTSYNSIYTCTCRYIIHSVGYFYQFWNVISFFQLIFTIQSSLNIACIVLKQKILANFSKCGIYRQLRARRALLQIKDVLLRTRRALLPLTLYSNSTLLVLNGTSLSCNNALLALNWRYASFTSTHDIT